MVGGKIVGVVVRGEEALLNVSDGRDECSVRCGIRRLDNERLIRIQSGDKAWWQAGKVYWTPIDSLCRYTESDEEIAGRTSDIPLLKIGFSH